MTTEQLTNEADVTLRLREAKLRDEAQSQLQEQQRRLEEAKAKAISEVVEEVTSSERKSARQAVLSIARRVRGKARAEASEAVASVTDESERRINELKKYNEQRLRDVEYEKDSEMLRALKSAHAQKRDELQQKEKELERDAAKALDAQKASLEEAAKLRVVEAVSAAESKARETARGTLLAYARRKAKDAQKLVRDAAANADRIREEEQSKASEARSRAIASVTAAQTALRDEAVLKARREADMVAEKRIATLEHEFRERSQGRARASRR